MAKKGKEGKAKSGPVKAEAATESVPTVEPVEEEAVKVAEKPAEPAKPAAAIPAPAKEAPKPAETDKKPASPKQKPKQAPAKPKEAQPVQNGTAGETTTAAEGTASEAEGTATIRKRRNRRHRKKRPVVEGAEDEQQAPPTEQKPKKEHKKKRAKRLRALALAESSANAQIAAVEGAIAGTPGDAPKTTNKVEVLQKKIEIAEKVLQQVQQQTNDEQKKLDNLKPASPKQQNKNKQPRARNDSETQKQAQAEVKKATEERDRIKNEAKKLVEEKVKKQQQIQKLQAEKDQKEQEAKRLLEEKDRKVEEAAKLLQQHARVEAVEQKINELATKKSEPAAQQQQQRTRKDSEKQKKQAKSDESAKKVTDEKPVADKKAADEQAKKVAAEKEAAEKKAAAEKAAAEKAAAEKAAAEKAAAEKAAAEKAAAEKAAAEKAAAEKAAADKAAAEKAAAEKVTAEKAAAEKAAAVKAAADKAAAEKAATEKAAEANKQESKGNQNQKSNKKNKRTPKNSVSEDEKSTGPKNVESSDFVSSAKPEQVVAKSLETAAVAAVAAACPVAAAKPDEKKSASPEKTASAKPAPADQKKSASPPKTNGTPAKTKPQPAPTTPTKQQTPSKSPEKTLPKASTPTPVKKAPSPPKTVPSRASPKPSTPPTTPKPTKKPELPPKPEFLKKKSPSVEDKPVQATTKPATPPAEATAPPQVPSATPAAPSPAPVSPAAPTPPASPVAEAPTGDANDAAATARLTEELNGSAVKKPAASNTKAPKSAPKKPEVPPKPDVHSKSAAKMKTPIKQPAATGSKASTVTNEPIQNVNVTSIQSDSRSPATELSRSEAFKKNMEIISTLADILLSQPKKKRTSTPADNPTPSTSSTPSSTTNTADTTSNQPSVDATNSKMQEPKPKTPKSSLNLDRILSILQTTQNGNTAGGSGSSNGAANEQPLPSTSSASSPASPHQALLNKDTIRVLMPTLQEVNVKFNAEKHLAALNATIAAASRMPKTLPAGTETTEEDELDEDFDEEEESIEYKFTPRPVFLATNCQICKNPLRNIIQCETCHMVSYCSEEHRRLDAAGHKDLCGVIVELAKRRGGHIYNMAHKLCDEEYRNLRVYTLNQAEQMLRRPLQAFEREVLLFPRTCCSPSCREWRQELLTECKDCRQVSFCAAHPDHLLPTHGQWCKAFFLFQKLILRQKILGRIEPVLPVRIAGKSFQLPPNIDEVIKLLYKSSNALRDECAYATLTQIATAPLTALHGYLQTGLRPTETFTIHLVGAELQFEGDTLDKWEAFFLHIVPEITELRVVFVGPELNVENLPIDIISRIRMCRACRQKCRAVKFDFQCRRFYHDFRQDSCYSQPNLICFYNPGLHRSTGFGTLDTWPKTIAAATGANCPILITAYTEYECPLDLERLQKETKRPLEVIQMPTQNPFASQRPDRNFISQEIAPMIFKNYFYFMIK